MSSVNRPLSRRYGPRLSYLEPISYTESAVPTTEVVAVTYPVAVNPSDGITGVLPALTASLTGSPSVLDGITGVLPALQGSIFGGGAVAGTLPSLQASLSGDVPLLVVIAGTLPALQASIDVTTGADAQIAGTLPALTGSIYGGAALAGTLPSLTASFSTFVGTNAAIAGTLPVLTASVAITSETHGQIAGTLPALTAAPPGAMWVTLPALTAYISASADVTVTYEAYAINLATGAVTHYTNYPFDNILRFGDKYYGVAPTGLFEIGGSLDLTTAIDARVKTFSTQLGSSKMKRVPYVYSSGRSDGGVSVGVIADEGTTYSYESDWGEVAGSTNHRTQVGKGIRGVYYAFDVSNISGSSLELDSLDVSLEATERAI